MSTILNTKFAINLLTQQRSFLMFHYTNKAIMEQSCHFVDQDTIYVRYYSSLLSVDSRIKSSLLSLVHYSGTIHIKK